jgi:hypothetical protein
MQFPRTLIEFQDQFPDDAHCWSYLCRARWPDGFECPRCGGRGSHFLANRRLEQCRSCRYQSSVTAGAVFHGTRVSLRVWFLGVFFLARHKKEISALQFQKDTGIGSYQTTWTLLHKLRSGLSAIPAPLLTGKIEADETYIGGYRKGGHGRHEVDGLPWAHTVFGNLKTWLRGAYHGVSPKHLQRYLNEFQFRFNERWSEADLSSPVLHAAIAAEPFPYRRLTAEPTG